MVPALLSRLIILVFGNLYPAYASYKAVKTKNVKEYVKWMMYWIVFALFTVAESLADVFVALWCPFYYEMKIVFIVWLLAPQTRGSSFLYRKFIHPTLNQKEQHIDEYIHKAKDRGYHAIVQLGSKGLTFASQAVMQTAVQGQVRLLHHLRRSYSMDDISDPAAAAGHRPVQALAAPGGPGGGLYSEDEGDLPPTPTAALPQSQSQLHRPTYREDTMYTGRDVQDNRDAEALAAALSAHSWRGRGRRQEDLMFNPIWESREVLVESEGDEVEVEVPPPPRLPHGDTKSTRSIASTASAAAGSTVSEIEKYKESKLRQHKKKGVTSSGSSSSRTTRAASKGGSASDSNKESSHHHHSRRRKQQPAVSYIDDVNDDDDDDNDVIYPHHEQQPDNIDENRYYSGID